MNGALALRRFDAHEGFAGSGFVSTAAWLACRIETEAVAAREHVRVAKELGKLPIIGMFVDSPPPAG